MCFRFVGAFFATVGGLTSVYPKR